MSNLISAKSQQMISFTLFRRPYLTGRATIGRLELPPGEGRFVCEPPTRSPPTHNGLYGRVLLCMDTLPPDDCGLRFFFLPRLSGFGNRVLQGGGGNFVIIIFLLGFPATIKSLVETGSCRGGSANVSLFFPLGFPDLETGSYVCYTHRGESIHSTSSSILPQVHCVIDLFGSLGFPDLETECCVSYTQGGVDSVNFVICNIFFRFCQRITEFGNSVVNWT